MEKQNKIPNNIIVREKANPEYTDRDIIRLSNDFIQDFFLSEGSLELTINCYKIIFEIMKIIHNDQFRLEESKRTGQLYLFEKDFLMEDNTYLSLKIRNAKITRNYKLLEDAYEKLVKYKQGWYKMVNSKGEKIKNYGGLISNVSYKEGGRGYTKFSVSAYWLKKLLNLAQYGYNNILAGIIQKTSSPQTIRTMIWLENRKEDSERLTIKYLNETFGIHYKTAYDLCEKFLKIRKEFLDKNSLTSFNATPDGIKHVFIERYKTKTINQNNLIAPDSVNEMQAKSYQISYYKKRHKLSTEQVAILKREVKKRPENKELINEGYERLIAFTKIGCNGRYKVMTDYKGYEFLINLQSFINTLCEEREIPITLRPNFGQL